MQAARTDTEVTMKRHGSSIGLRTLPASMIYWTLRRSSLTRIYELPNIEISEAFLKLREEARCRLQVPDKLNDGLNLILNTNLMYFSTPQKGRVLFPEGHVLLCFGAE